jgi:hypothetical protein
MLVFERVAVLLVVVHGVAAAVLAGAATHLARATLGRLRGRPAWPRESLLAAVTGLTYVLVFGLGLMLYPTYRVRVRAEYLDAPRMVAAEAGTRARLRAEATKRPVPVLGPPPRLGHVARLFDIKEHWTALGLPVALGLLLLRRRAGADATRPLLRLYAGAATAVTAVAWLAAVIGLYTASQRAIGGGG